MRVASRAATSAHSVAAWPRAIVDGWFAPAPAERLAAMRILVGLFVVGYLVARGGAFWHLTAMPARDFAPVGLARLVGTPLAASTHHAIVVATALLALAFAAGVLHRWLAPLFALGLTWVLGYRSSWGMLFHTDNLLVLHVAVLALAPAADAWSVDAWRRGARSPSARPRRGGSPRPPPPTPGRSGGGGARAARRARPPGSRSPSARTSGRGPCLLYTSPSPRD